MSGGDKRKHHEICAAVVCDLLLHTKNILNKALSDDPAIVEGHTLWPTLALRVVFDDVPTSAHIDDANETRLRNRTHAAFRRAKTKLTKTAPQLVEEATTACVQAFTSLAFKKMNSVDFWPCWFIVMVLSALYTPKWQPSRLERKHLLERGHALYAQPKPSVAKLHPQLVASSEEPSGSKKRPRIDADISSSSSFASSSPSSSSSSAVPVLPLTCSSLVPTPHRSGPPPQPVSSLLSKIACDRDAARPTTFFESELSVAQATPLPTAHTTAAVSVSSSSMPASPAAPFSHLNVPNLSLVVPPSPPSMSPPAVVPIPFFTPHPSSSSSSPSPSSPPSPPPPLLLPVASPTAPFSHWNVQNLPLAVPASPPSMSPPAVVPIPLPAAHLLTACCSGVRRHSLASRVVPVAGSTALDRNLPAIEVIFESIGVSAWTPVFRDEEIDSELLLELTESELLSLVKKMGPRKRIWKFITTHRLFAI